MHILIMELLECAVIQRFTNPLHQMIVEIQVVHNSQTHTQHFICLLQVADVSAAVIAADRAIALRVNGLFVTLIFQVFNVDDAVPSEQVAMAGVRLGMTQSNKSTPRYTPSMMLPGVPTPIR